MQKEYRVKFDVTDVADLAVALHRDDVVETPIAIISGAGIVGLSAALRMVAYYNRFVVLLERRFGFSRHNTIDVKRSTLRFWGRSVLSFLIRRNALTFLRECDRAEFDNDTNSHDGANAGSNGDDDTILAVGRLNDMQSGLLEYLYKNYRDRVLVCRLHIDASPQSLASKRYRFVCRHTPACCRFELIYNANKLAAPVVLFAEGNNKARIETFGGDRRLSVTEFWSQRYYEVSFANVVEDTGVSIVTSNAEKRSVQNTHLLRVPGGWYMGISRVRCNADYDEASDDRDHGEALREAETIINKAKREKLMLKRETSGRSCVAVTLSCIRRPIHPNALMVGDICGVGSPIRGTGANNGIKLLARGLECMMSPNDAALRKDAEREYADFVFQTYKQRHVAAARYLNAFEIYDAALVDKVVKTFGK